MYWKAGDIAICIKVDKLDKLDNIGVYVSPPLRLGCEYIVKKVKMCECGETDLDVGLATSTDSGIECICGAVSSPLSGIWWCSSIRFVKKEIKEELELELELAIDNDQFEKAATLRDKIKSLNE